jgi:hypothetical protein
MRGQRSSNLGAIIVALCAVIVVGVTAWATLSGGTNVLDPSAPSTPRDLRSQEQDPIVVVPASPSALDAAARSTAVVHAVTHGVVLDCVEPGPLRAGGTFDTTCTARSVGGFDGTMTFACSGASWLDCDVDPSRARVAPEDPVALGVHVALGPLARSGSHTLRVTARTGALTYDTEIPFGVQPSGIVADVPTFACGTWSALIHPGGVVRVPCTLQPHAYTASIGIRCLDDVHCHAEPATFDTTGRTAPIPFELVVASGYDALPGDVTQTVQMVGGSGQMHAFAVHVPAVVGTVDVDCPLTFVIPTSGTTPLPCTLTSTDGFDGYIRIDGTAIVPVGSIEVEATDVRVPAGETVDVTVSVVSSGLPIAPVILSVDLTPVAWSAGPASIALNVTL